MKQIKYLLSTILLLTPLFIHADNEKKPLGTGFEIEMEKELPGGFELEAGLEFHLCENFSDIEHYRLGVQGAYEINTWLKSIAGYHYVNIHLLEKELSDTKDWTSLHKLFAGAEGTWQLGDFAISLRELYQWNNPNTFHVLCSRLALSYDIPGTPLNANASYEIQNNLKDSFKLCQTHFKGGLGWSISENHELEISYGYFGHEFLENESAHIIGLGYKWRF